MAVASGMKPKEFWRVTPLEFIWFCEAADKRWDLEMDMVAWHAAHLMSMWAKKGSKITVDKLRGKEKHDNNALASMIAPESKPSFNSPEEFRAFMNKRRDEIEERQEEASNGR